MVGPEMLVAAAVNQVARKINEVIGVAQGEVKLCCSFGDDLESIKDTLVYLEGLLKNAENNFFGSERANLRHWLGQIIWLTTSRTSLMGTTRPRSNMREAAALRR